MKTELLIVGGGLSGLALTRQLEQQGRDYLLVEARDRWGGRILSQHVAGKSGEAVFDLGPAWFWPGQPRIADLINEFKLGAFYQYAEGDLMYEDVSGAPQRGRGFSSMEGAYRLAGGLGALITCLRDSLPVEKLRLGHKVVRVQRNEKIETIIVGSDGEEQSIVSEKIVLALPPRLAADTITFKPALSDKQYKAMQDTPTWMAGHAKVIAVYDTPFWRQDGLSGDAMSRRGPMVEIHDASPASGGPYALFGFMGTSVTARQGREADILKDAKDQLIRLFGKNAAHPISLHLQDWAFEKETATSRDHQSPTSHPDYGLPAVLKDLWGGHLLLGSTEVAPLFGGYLEGALEASEVVAANLAAD